MKILLCKSHLAGPVSGADETLVAYATRLHDAGHGVTVVLLHQPVEEDAHQARLAAAGVRIEAVVNRSSAYRLMRAARAVVLQFFLFLYFVPGAARRLRRLWQTALHLVATRHYPDCQKYFARADADIVHVFTPDTGAALMIRAARAARLPVLYHELGTPHHLPALDVYYRRLARVLPLCTEVVALSPTLAADWSRRYADLPHPSVLPLIVDDRVSARLPNFFFPAGVIFGFAARLEEGKGPLVLVEALARVCAEGIEPQPHVRFAGAGEQLGALKRRALELGVAERCTFAGAYTTTIGKGAFLANLDVFVLPTFAEGTPNSIIEAMAHSLPVIASRVGGIPDLVTEETGILVEPGDADALAAAMLRLARDPDLRRRMGRRARERYESFFAPDVVLPLVFATYERVRRHAALADLRAEVAPLRPDRVGGA